MGSAACIALIQLTTHYALPNIMALAFQFIYAVVLYNKFKSMDFSTIKSIK